MALINKSLFLYGYSVTAQNRSLDFDTGGVEKRATLRLGFYSLTSLLAEVRRAMKTADPAHNFTATATRTFSGGTQNRIFIGASSVSFTLLFGTGSRTASSSANLLGFSNVDYSALVIYGGSFTTGSSLVPEYVGYNYLGPEFFRKVFGAVNVSANGGKEAIVFSIQRFFQMEFRYEPQAKVIASWVPLYDWMIQQRTFEFTPSIIAPNLFYECTLESTQEDGKGLGYSMKEMLPQFPFNYQTGLLKFRQVVPPGGFL